MLPLQGLKQLSSTSVSYSCCRWNPVTIKSASFFSKSKKTSSTLDLEALKSAESISQAEEVLPAPVTADRGPLPIITKRELKYVHPCRPPRQAWVDNLDTIDEKKLGLVDLHPDVFATYPRLALIHENYKWQQLYKHVNWNWSPSRGDIQATGRKPWPQKGLGKARHGDIKSPIWLKGAKAHGPKGPKTYFYMLPFYSRVQGLTGMLSVKYAQDDLKIVDSLDIPTEDPKFLEDLVDNRAWGKSVLFIDDTDLAPRNIALATDTIGHMNIMPVYGLNVFSMLKHETLVLTLAALDKIEERLIMHLNSFNHLPPTARKNYMGVPKA